MFLKILMYVYETNTLILYKRIGTHLRTPHIYLVWQIPSDILVWFSWVYAIFLSQNIIYGMLYVIETCVTYYFILFIPAIWRYTDIVSKYIQNEQLEWQVFFLYLFELSIYFLCLFHINVLFPFVCYFKAWNNIIRALQFSIANTHCQK